MLLLIVIAFVSLVNANIYYDLNNDIYEETKNSRNFTGKVVLVTGSSSGIGEGTVKLFSVLGAKVIVTGRNETKIKRVAEEVHKLSPHGLKPLEVVADLTKAEDLKRLVDSTIKEYGRLDVLVNNAGSGAPASIRDDKILDEFDNTFKIDVRSIVELIHLTIPYMEKSKGTIINISSLAALRPYPGWIPYYMSKAALDMMTRVLALELAPSGIRVNTINPGYIETNFGNATGVKVPDEATNKIITKIVNSTPLKRPGKPIDIANAIAFLSSSDASFITGANLVVDGGFMYNIPNDLYSFTLF